ncbi:hypothetical protein GUITHDRAFT_137635 [Guillardia theta CCMP2712]|uniref:PDZ domain-containing protein n=1 Tax=Guillardia theta (strain CCMP2712) TaxID=905079 RepID=L1JHB1_GUITC|nr:hypothetical protein GUITHDRAFT_137635 [Guillardia theta CCMP2712]EKX47485.1 hypothetical protein GUITHDRAFT_137635 [Guillardia theta CCMP2712]|eukprot:XP_005834465.1 hypothetical protein GUITHDRAFT_137635 [Guillardia theta CCMP2712]
MNKGLNHLFPPQLLQLLQFLPWRIIKCKLNKHLSNELEIVRLARGGSAEKSGQIQPGDVVFEVDNHDVYKKPFQVFVQHIQGPVGTFVEVKVFKNGDPNNARAVLLERTLNPEDPNQAANKQKQRAQQPLTSNVSGAADIGIQFDSTDDGCFQITHIKPGGPADVSGHVEIGDIIYEIDGVKVFYGIGPNGRTVHPVEIAEMLRGPEGSVMVLRLQKAKGGLAQINLVRSSGTAPKPQQPQISFQVSTTPKVAQQPIPPQQAPAPPAPPPQPTGPGPVAPKAALVDLTPAREYQPTTGESDIFGLGLAFKNYGNGQIRIAKVIDNGPAKQYGKDKIQEGDWLIGIGNERNQLVPIRGGFRPLATMKKMLSKKLWMDRVILRLRHAGAPDSEFYDVTMYKGRTGVKREDCEVGIVFHQDLGGHRWVRVKQVIPNGPADLLGNVVKVNDRILEVNGQDIARKPLETWHNLLTGKEDTECVMTFANFKGELYTCNVVRKPVGIVAPEAEDAMDQKDLSTFINLKKVDPNAINIPSPNNEKPVRVMRPRMVPQKKYVANLSGVHCGISFVKKEDRGEVVVDHLNLNGPAFHLNPKNISADWDVKKILPGDVVHKIGDAPTSPVQVFPYQDVYKKTVHEWAHAITDGQPGTDVLIEFERTGKKYEALVPRAPIITKTGVQEWYSPGISFSYHNETLYVEKDGIVPGSYAETAPGEQLVPGLLTPTGRKFDGIREYYQLVSIDNLHFGKGKFDEIQQILNEMLIGPQDSQLDVVFKTAGGNIKYTLKRDQKLKMQGVEGEKGVKPLAFAERQLMPGKGVPVLHPMCNPPLWKSLVQDCMAAARGEAFDDKSFKWRGRILLRTGSTPGIQMPDGMWKVEDVKTKEVMYYGPGPSELSDAEQQEMETPQEEEIGAGVSDQLEASAPVSSAQHPASPSSQPAPPPAERKSAPQSPTSHPQIPAAPQMPPPPPPAPPAPQVEPPAPPAPPAAPEAPATSKDSLPPTVQAAPTEQKQAESSQAPAETDEDDESVLKLSDGSKVEAINLEKVLLRHLDAVAHVMVVGSGKEFLSCMLVLKTKGSEAAERGEDPSTIPDKDDLAEPALELTRKVQSDATTVQKARACTKFRANGLLPGFAAANQEIAVPAQQVRRFSILVKHFSKKSGEINADGSLNRLLIKKQNKNIIDGMYQQKAPASAKQ